MHKKVVIARQTVAELDDDVNSGQHSNDAEVITDITSLSDDLSYIASTPLQTSTPIKTFLVPPSGIPSEQFHPMPGIIIIGVVVGVVGILLGVGWLLGVRRQRRAAIEDQITGITNLGYDNGESAYVLQRAHTQSVEFKRGVLINVPSRDRVVL